MFKLSSVTATHERRGDELPIVVSESGYEKGRVTECGASETTEKLAHYQPTNGAA